MNANYLNIVGLAYRARKCSTGEDTIVKDVQSRRAKLVLIANDVGIQTKKKLTDKCAYYNVTCIEVDDRAILGQAMGKQERVAVAILDAGFANKLESLLL